MKKTFIIFGLAAIASIAFSCTREDGPIEKETIPSGEQTTPGEEQGTSVDLSQYDPSKYLVSFGASIEDVTKADINLAEGTVSFQNDDRVLVVSGSNSAEYKYDGTEFKAVSTPLEQSGELKAYYPKDYYSFDSGVVTFTMPEATTENPGTLAPMCGVISENIASFKNLGAILQLKLTGAEPITAIELITDKKITGSAELNWNAAGIPEIGGLNGATSVKHTYTSAIAAGTATPLYFFLPAGVELGSLEIHAIYGKKVGEVTYEPFRKISRNSSMTPARNEIVSITKSLSGFFSGGDGLSEATAYEIANANDFKKISTLANATEVVGGNGYNATAGRTFFGSEGVYYKQTADIDFSNDNISDYMIGSNERPFAGTYKSGSGGFCLINKYTLSKDDDYIGLFRKVTGTINNVRVGVASVTGKNSVGAIVGLLDGGTVSNCQISDVIFSAEAIVGGIVGESTNSATIDHCETLFNPDASVKTTAQYTGGILGQATGFTTISNCTNMQTISGNLYTGGIVGGIDAGSIENCSNGSSDQDITLVFEQSDAPNAGFGGIAGQAVEATITRCFNYAILDNTKYDKSYAAGIVAHVTGATTISECINSGRIDSKGTNVGGIVGYFQGAGVIKSCYTAQNGSNITNGKLVGAYISGKARVGGIVGNQANAETWIINCSSKALVRLTTHGGTAYAAGGLVGVNNGTIANCLHWDNWVICTDITDKNSSTNGKQMRIGCIAGYNTGTVINCYSMRTPNNMGGIQLSGSNYARRAVLTNANGSVNTNATYMGQIVGDNAGGTITNCYSRTRWTDSNPYGGRPVGYSTGTLNNVLGMGYKAQGVLTEDYNTTGATNTSGEQVTSVTINGNDYDLASTYVRELLTAGVPLLSTYPYYLTESAGLEWVVQSETYTYPVPKALFDLGKEYYSN